MIYISRRARFCASHRLYNPTWSTAENEARYGCCNNYYGHGHNYELEVIVSGSIDDNTGMVMDLKDLKDLIENEIIAHVDHKNLNLDVPFLKGVIPTTENVVALFWERLADKLPSNCQLYEMKLWETENNMAFYRGEGVKVARHEV